MSGTDMMKNSEFDLDFESLSPAEGAAKLICLAAEKELLKKAVFSKPADAAVVKMCATPKRISGKAMLQAEYFMSDNKALHKNMELDSALYRTLLSVAENFSQINIITTAGECELRRSKSGNSTLIGGMKLYKKLCAGEAQAAEIGTNDRQKSRILDGSEPFLVHLGVSDENGRIFDRKRSKFKQINRFLEMIRDVLPSLPKGEINVCDLCCGKSYLSFAAYHYFANVLGYKVTMYGADLKSDVIEYCESVARKLDFDGLHFVCADVNKFEPEWTSGNKVHLVISLHACDIATDIVLDNALRWGADVILSTPCCHHELNRTLNCPALDFISDYSMLKQKLCDAATDALRLKYLEANGYACEALELIDPEETPKNVMLRAIKRKSFSDTARAKAEREYEAARLFLLGGNAAKKFDPFN